MKSTMKYPFCCILFSALALSPAHAKGNDTSGGRISAGAFVGLDSVEFEIANGSDDAMVPFYGLTLGYDYELASGIVLGAEAEFADSGAEFSANNIFIAGDSARIETGRELYIGARLGLRTGRNGLLYVKGGYANASVAGEYETASGILGDDDNLSGFRLGAGGEIEVDQRIAVRLEYRYSDYGDLGGFDVGLSRSQALIGVIGRF